MKQYLLMASLCFASSLLGSAATLTFLPNPSEAPEPLETAQPPEWVMPQELELGKVVLVDAQGTARIVLAANSSEASAGPEIAFFDSYGTRKMTLGISDLDQPFLAMENSILPDPEHKRIALSVTDTHAKIEVGHGEIREILLQSARPADTAENRIELRARNSSTTALYVSDYGRATLEVTDDATNPVFQFPEGRQFVLDEPEN